MSNIDKINKMHSEFLNEMAAASEVSVNKLPPLPFRQFKIGAKPTKAIIAGPFDNNIMVATCDTPEIAAFIVRACNNYSPMLEALKEAKEVVKILHYRFEETGTGHSIIEKIEAAIQNAQQ